MSKAFAARIESPRTTQSNFSVLSPNNYLASNRGVAHRLDNKGNRPPGISFLPAHARKTPAMPTGTGTWSSLGPPGGDVSDAAVSTVDPTIALAGIAPQGGFGGTLYRSSDGGNTWSKVLALDGISIFDIEFTPGGDRSE